MICGVVGRCTSTSKQCPLAQFSDTELLAHFVRRIPIVLNLAIPFLSLQPRNHRSRINLYRTLVRLLLPSLFFCFWPQAANAEHLCAERYNEYMVREVYDQTGNIVEYWCEWGSEGDAGAAAMRYFSPEEWKAFAEHENKVEARNSRERMLAGQRYRRLQQGLWFMPGEVPFAGWASGSASASKRAGDTPRLSKDCTISYWTPLGAVFLSTVGGRNANAVISYMGHSIPAPKRSQSRKFSLT